MHIKKFVLKYKDVIPYGVFGVLTTLVNIGVYWVMAHPIGLGVMPSTLIAWGLAVLFAYLTNRKWVFRSEAANLREIFGEISSFFVCRLATGLADWACMYIFVDMFQFNDVAIKTGANILVIVLNYVASKFVIFRHKKQLPDS